MLRHFSIHDPIDGLYLDCFLPQDLDQLLGVKGKTCNSMDQMLTLEWILRTSSHCQAPLSLRLPTENTKLIILLGVIPRH